MRPATPINAVLAAADYNFRRLIQWLTRISHLSHPDGELKSNFES
jgi:hypothetical protein